MSWVEQWEMEFNPSEWEVNHFGMININKADRVNGRVLRGIDIPRDIEVQVRGSLQRAT